MAWTWSTHLEKMRFVHNQLARLADSEVGEMLFVGKVPVGPDSVTGVPLIFPVRNKAW